jgi:hypothetical protein
MKRYNVLRKRYNISFVFWPVLALLTRCPHFFSPFFIDAFNQFKFSKFNSHPFSLLSRTFAYFISSPSSHNGTLCLFLSIVIMITSFFLDSRLIFSWWHYSLDVMISLMNRSSIKNASLPIFGLYPLLIWELILFLLPIIVEILISDVTFK